MSLVLVEAERSTSNVTVRLRQTMSNSPEISRVDEMTLGEFLRGVADILRWCKRNIIGLAFFSLVGIGLSLAYFLNKPTTYDAHLTFILADDNASQLAGLSSVLGQLGIPFSKGKYNVDKLMLIAKSRSIISNALIKTTTINENSDILANHFIRIYELDKKWIEGENDEMEGFQFTPQNITLLSSPSKFAIKKLHHMLVGSPSNNSNALVQLDYGNPDYVMSIDVSTLDEELSVSTASMLYEELENHFVSLSNQTFQSTYNLIKTKRDSVYSILNNTQYKIARLRDRSANTFTSTNTVEISSLSSQVIGLQLGLQKLEENLGVAEYAMRTNSPMIQLLDAPMSPISPSRPSIVRSVLIGLIGGLAFYFIFFLSREVIRLV